MEPIDFKKLFKEYYSPKPGQPEIVTIPRMQFAMVDGAGDPNKAAEFQNAIGALYGVVYTLKMGHKKQGKKPDFSVAPLEGLWWADGGKMFGVGTPDKWLWTLMIWLPDFITKTEFTQAVEQLKIKKPNPVLDHVRLESVTEGRAVQIMHIGPYATEKGSVQLMHTLAEQQGYAQSGKHHEIYLGDPRRAKPGKLRTIVRHPIAKV